jgi:hypothetical protein
MPSHLAWAFALTNLTACHPEPPWNYTVAGSAPGDSSSSTEVDTAEPPPATLRVVNQTEVPLGELWICQDRDCHYMLDGIGLSPGDAWEWETPAGLTNLAAVDVEGGCNMRTNVDLEAGVTYEWIVEEMIGTWPEYDVFGCVFE